MSGVIARIDDFGRPAWIALMVLGFIVFWPIGLAILAYLIWSGRMGMGCGWHRHGADIEEWRQRAVERVNRAAEHLERKRARWEERRQRWGGPHGGPDGERGGRYGGGLREGLRETGNRAFDEYRAEALRKLEEEADEFRAFLERLRMARDRAEFDEYIKERRNRPAGPAQDPQAPQQP
jgi:predicted small metal-binding protein